MPPIIYAVANQKGGVGKTTTAVNLAASLAIAEHHTLLVDCDPQSNATTGAGIPRRDVERSLYDVLIERETLDACTLPTDLETLSVVPATRDMVAVEVELVDAADRALRLKRALEASHRDYAFVVLDCPPSLGLLTLNALVAAHKVVVPLQCEYYPLEGLTDLMATIDRVRGSLNPGLAIDGIVLTMYDARNSLTHQVADEVRKHFRVFDTVIPRNVKLSEAPSHGKPAILYDVQSKGAQSYLGLAREVLEDNGKQVGRPRKGKGSEGAAMTDKKVERRALGRGLDALLPPPKGAAPAGFGEKSVFTCPIELVVPQKGQPRQHFDDAELEELTQSIREHGVLEPLVVRKVGGQPERYELIAGERRWRAAQRAGLHDVIVVVKDVSPKDAFELALVENLQRADLNPIEVAESFDRLIKEHGYTQETIAKRVGKDRTTVANALRLLRLPARIRGMVVGRELSEGHARALLGAPSEEALEQIADQVVRGRLPVRKVEELIRQAKKGPKQPGERGAAPKKPASIRDLEARIERRVGAKAEVRDQGGSGELAIRYASLDDLDRILAVLGVPPA